MTTGSPRTTAQALAYARAEHDQPTRDWTGAAGTAD